METSPNPISSPRDSSLPQDLILQALDDVLSSGPFRNTQQCQNLLIICYASV
jgi:hypothetical protein